MDSISDFCPLNGCNTTFFTYSGISFPALLGLIWFILYPFLKGKYLKLWQILALIGILSLGGIALAKSYFCPFCLAAYTAGILLITIDNLAYFPVNKG
jgi:hypothetical protein